MKVFLDTNVLLDWLLDRRETYADEATQLIEAAELGLIKAFISAGSVYTVAYVLERSGRKGPELRRAMLRVLSILNVCPVDNTPYEKACASDFEDIEDAFQYEVALHNGQSEYFVTGNMKDYAAYGIDKLPVVTPAQMEALLLK